MSQLVTAACLLWETSETFPRASKIDSVVWFCADSIQTPCCPGVDQSGSDRGKRAVAGATAGFEGDSCRSGCMDVYRAAGAHGQQDYLRGEKQNGLGFRVIRPRFKRFEVYGVERF